MDLPQEIEIWHVIPLIRKLLVFDMKKRGMKQKDIAACMDLTAPAVSQYVKEKRAKEDNCKIPKDVEEVIHASATKIINCKTDKNQAVKEINNLCALFREKKIICQIHMKKDSSLEKCNICYE